MKKLFRFRWGLVFVSSMVFMFFGCSKESIKMSNLAPEEQFSDAKRIFDKKDYYKAKMQFTVLVMNNPGSNIVEDGQFYLAECHFNLKEYLLAISEYEKLIKSLPQSSYVDDARYKMGLCYEKLSPGYGLDQDYTQKAISQYQQFLEDYPTSELRTVVENHLSECRDKLGKKEYMTGELYRKMGYNASALISFNNVLENYSDTQYVDDALFWKGECLRKLKDKSGALDAFQILITRFADSTYGDKARARIKDLVKEKK